MHDVGVPGSCMFCGLIIRRVATGKLMPSSVYLRSNQALNQNCDCLFPEDKFAANAPLDIDSNSLNGGERGASSI